jgi:RNA polymerase sigma-70 factor (ECF subfamily)
MDDQQERAIARGLREGNADAWRALYDAYAERVWRCVARLMPPSSAEVADVVQETFLAAARSARTFDPARGTLWLWLWGIARRGVALHYRKHGRPRAGGEALEALAGPGGGPPDAAEAAELVSLVRVTLAELPGEYESLLTAKYLDGDSVERMAAAEGCTPVALRSKLARARRAFREQFHKAAPPPPDRPARAHHDPAG